MGVKSYVTRKMLERQLKDMPEQQRMLFMRMIEKNPTLFETIAKEVQQKKKEGQDETLASMAVMKKYQTELQSLMFSLEKKA